MAHEDVSDLWLMQMYTNFSNQDIYIPLDASINGFSVRSGQSTTDTETSSKFSLRPSARTEKKSNHL